MITAFGRPFLFLFVGDFVKRRHFSLTIGTIYAFQRDESAEMHGTGNTFLPYLPICVGLHRHNGIYSGQVISALLLGRRTSVALRWSGKADRGVGLLGVKGSEDVPVTLDGGRRGAQRSARRQSISQRKVFGI